MNDELFENWRRSRVSADPPPDFVDRVMGSIAAAPPPTVESPRRRWSFGLRTGLVAAAVAVALFRAAELLSVFSATGLEMDNRNHLALQEPHNDN